MTSAQPQSVWDYPRPPRIEPTTRQVRVIVGDTVVAASRRAVRVLEASHPPTWYLPPEDVRTHLLVPSASPSTLCEFKGRAVYYDAVTGKHRVAAAAWSYHGPEPAYAPLRHWLAFYASRVECYVDQERVIAEPGPFYGGWITSDVTGPFDGPSGSLHA